MAIKQVNKGATIPELVCQNVDVGNLPVTNVPAGTKCWVSDAGVVLRFDGASWKPYSEPTSIVGSLAKSGKLTATTVDQSIDVNFNRISISNVGQNELILAIDESTATATNLIYIASGESFSEALSGGTLHYSVAVGTTIGLYVLS